MQGTKIIDFLSLDIEGNEIEALEGVDHTEFRFRWILVECWNKEKVIDYLTQRAYTPVEDFGSDILFRDVHHQKGDTAVEV